MKFRWGGVGGNDNVRGWFSDIAQKIRYNMLKII